MWGGCFYLSRCVSPAGCCCLVQSRARDIWGQYSQEQGTCPTASLLSQRAQLSLGVRRGGGRGTWLLAAVNATGSTSSPQLCAVLALALALLLPRAVWGPEPGNLCYEAPRCLWLLPACVVFPATHCHHVALLPAHWNA